MKKLVLIPILLFFALAAFFSCTKDAQPPDAKDTAQSHILSMTKGEDGILNLSVSVQPSAGGVVADRDGCAMYEALRFTLPADCSSNPIPPPDEYDDPVLVDWVEFRLIKINKTTHDRTAVTGYVTADDVRGVNISWYNVSPLSDYYYATEYKECTTSVDLGNCTFFYINEFWGKSQYVQLDPWDCDNNVAQADFGFGEVTTPGYAFQVVTLNSNCSITGELPDPCWWD